MTTASLPRSFLYVPGNASEKLARADQRGADALILDLEDAVPVREKDGAQETVAEWLRGRVPGEGPALWVRVNSGSLREADVRAMAGLPALTGLVLAKVEDATEVNDLGRLLSTLGDGTTQLMPMVETASALLDARALASQPRVEQLQVGEIDLAGELGVRPGEDEAELAPLRAMVVVASRAAGISAPVGPVSRITADLEALEVSTRRTRRQGFMGRACIHPAQVAVVHAVFTPSADDVAEAQEVVRLVDTAEASGSGVVLDASGRMVDAAVLHDARSTLALARRAGLL